MLSVRLNLYAKEHFTWRHGGHVGVSNKSCGSLAWDQAPQWGKRQQTGSNMKNIGERSASCGIPRLPFFHFFFFFPQCRVWSQASGSWTLLLSAYEKVFFCLINLHRCWPREWKRTIPDRSCAGTRIIYNYPPKGRWIVVGGYNATRGVEVYNYRYEPTRGVSWIKIKKSKQKTSLSSEFVDVSIEGVSGINFFYFVANSVRNFFSTDQ